MGDLFTEALIYVIVAGTPWAFGTTQVWSIWTLNICAYVLGLTALAKCWLRWQTGHRPARWGELPPSSELFQIDAQAAGRKRIRLLRWTMLGVTFLFLAYALTSALNARATYFFDERIFEYHDFISWLPYSYDEGESWFMFWSFLGFACFFWATHDWLRGKSRSERHRSARRPEEGEGSESESESFPPARLRRLLWVLSINGALLSLESILQRLDGTSKLLWIKEPAINRDAESQFGPYAYRANCAQYLNLLWPVTLGFWLTLRRSALRAQRGFSRLGSGNHIVLLPGAVLMAAGPIISTARGGAFITIGLILAAIALMGFATRRQAVEERVGVFVLLLSALTLGGLLGWSKLSARLENLFVDEMSKRTEIYENAQRIAADFQLFGTGPGTFSTMYQLYRQPAQAWAGYVHDDWLEVRLTLGWLGFSMLLVLLGKVLVRPWLGAGIRAPIGFLGMCWLALGGLLLHAKFDFPFQVHSIVILFLTLCAVLFSLSLGRKE